MARFAVSVANLEYTPQEEELKNGRMEEWKLGSWEVRAHRAEAPPDLLRHPLTLIWGQVRS